MLRLGFLPVELKRACRHPLLNLIISDLGPDFLVLLDNILQNSDQELLDFSTQHFSASILLCDLGQLLIIVKEEAKVVVGDVHLQIGSVSSVLLDSLSATRESVLVDLLLDLVGGVS